MAFRFRLSPTAEQTTMLIRHCADARFMWNLALEQCGHARSMGQYADQMQWSRQLTEARMASAWLAAGSAHVQQQALRDLQQAFRNWWRRPSHFGHPTWRKIGTNESFAHCNAHIRQINDRWAEVRIAKAGWVRFRLTRAWNLLTMYKSARITLDRAGRWHVSLMAPQPPVTRSTTNVIIGLDLGITTSVTTSDGEHLRMPELLSSGERVRKLRLERKMARQKKGSNRRAVTRLKLAKVHAHEQDRRKDWIEKTTTDLVRKHDLIVIEDLKVQAMSRKGRGKRGLNRSIQSQSWATLRGRLEEKAAAATAPCQVIRVNPAYTSQRCNKCDHTAKENRESQAVFFCQRCGHTANADVNAARNILAAGLAVYGRGGNPVVNGTCEASIDMSV